MFSPSVDLMSTTALDLHACATARAAELPGATLTHPFGPDWDVFKVRGKVFLLLTAVTGSQQAILKVDPLDGEALRSEYSFISPGYHMNKRHWVSVHPNPKLTPQLLAELVTDSYRLVVEKLPRSQRSIDPSTFGEGCRRKHLRTQVPDS